MQLDRLSNKELGILFPIIVSDYNPEWINFFNLEKELILNAIGEENIIRIEHFGSTSIPNVKAKPTIDILLEIAEDEELNKKIIKILTGLNYHYINKPENPPPHMMFLKGYSEEGFKGQAYHIHVRYKGDWDELYFRDFLRLNPLTADEYSKLKLQLAIKFKNDREAYTEGKTDFIKRITETAKYLQRDKNS